MKTSSEGAFVEQRVLIKLDLPARIALIQTNGAVGEIDHLPQDQLRSYRERESVCVCVCERERESVCVCVCVRERERERESVCVCV